MIAYHRSAAVGWNPARAQFRQAPAVLSGPFPRTLLTGFGLGQLAVDLEFCKRVRCGAVLQHEVGLDRVVECSRQFPETAGVVGWCNLSCSAYWPEMQQKFGVRCQPGVASSAPAVPATPRAPTVPAMPSAHVRPGEPRPHTILFVPGPPVAPRWIRPKCAPAPAGCKCGGSCGCNGKGETGERVRKAVGDGLVCAGVGLLLGAIFGGGS